MSYKLIDRAMKDKNIPHGLQMVLAGWLSYGNKDGTSIRPTQRKVGERAKYTRETVARHTKTLVRLGILVHDLTPSGEYQKYDYPKHGVWAYVYHANLSRLDAPEVIAEFTEIKQSNNQARSAAATNRWLEKEGRGVTKYHTLGVTSYHKEGVTSYTPPPCDILSHPGDIKYHTDPSLTSYPTQEIDPSVISITEKEEEESPPARQQDNQIRGSEDEQKVKSVDQNLSPRSVDQYATKLEWFLTDPEVMSDESRLIEGEYQWRSGTRQDLDEFGVLWLSRTGNPMDEDDYERLCDLASRTSWEDVCTSIDLIFRCPITAKVPWLDFQYFYQRYDYTLPRARAWALAQERVGAVGGKTNPNPEDEDSNDPSADSNNPWDFTPVRTTDPVMHTFVGIVTAKGKWTPPEVKFGTLLDAGDEYSRWMSAVIRDIVKRDSYATYEEFLSWIEEARKFEAGY